MPELSDLVDLVAPEVGLAVVATARANGSIQSSVVNVAVLPHPVSGATCLAFVTFGRAKLANLRARPWTTVTGRQANRWVTVEGTTETTGPDDPLPGVDPATLPALVRGIYVAAGGTHEDWSRFDRIMAQERRAAVLITPTRIYSN